MDIIFPLLVLIGCIVFLVIKIKQDRERKAIEEERRRVRALEEKQYKELEAYALGKLGFPNWDIVASFDDCIVVKSRQALEKYDHIKYFKENKAYFAKVEQVLCRKTEVAKILNDFLKNNEYQFNTQYDRLNQQICNILRRTDAYRIKVNYISSAGNHLGSKEIAITRQLIDKLKNDPSVLMSKSEYNTYLKEQQKESLGTKQHKYYDIVNVVVDYANKNKDFLVIKGSQEKLDNLVAQLFDRTVNSIKKIKTIDSEEWDVIRVFITHIKEEMDKVILPNQRILKYYQSSDFIKIKATCEALMNTQREFNEYINEKVQSISKLFGTRVVRSETVNDDEYEYIRPYKKTITPFAAEVSAQVFASAENNPLEYVVKNFYPNKAMYPEQIQKLHLLIEELETLREAKQIIDSYKVEYQQYLSDVPDYITKEDEAGFYSRLGFANIDESALTVEYKFAYTSGGGMTQRSFTVPMTEETIIELIKILESKLTASAFTKSQRAMMTKKLRESIKRRDNFTCCICGNSTHAEPNLLLEIDHIVPVAKGGCTVEENLQTLCWKCNRSKGSKLQGE